MMPPTSQKRRPPSGNLKKLIRQLAFLFLDLLVIAAVLSSLTPGRIRAETISFSEGFSASTYINSSATTATVDTTQRQARLVSSDGWSARTGGVASTTTLNDVTAVPSSTTTAWAVGSSGTIYKTTDGGFTWAPQTSGVSVALNGANAADANTAWAVGASGTILKTSNGGTSWAAQTSGTTETLNAVFAFDTSTVYAVGASGTILKTSNGGTSWAAQTSGITTAINDVFATTANDVYAVATNSGTSTVVLRTQDGSTWSSQRTGVAAMRGLYASRSGSLDTIIFVGDSGTIFSSVDNAATFVDRTSGTSQNLRAVSLIAGTPSRYVVTAASGLIIEAADVATWNTYATSTQNGDLRAVAGITGVSGLAVAVGASGVMLRRFGSTTPVQWKAVNPNGETTYRAAALLDQSPSAISNALVVGDSGMTRTATLNDSSPRWFSSDPTALRAVAVFNSVGGSWGVGASGTIVRSAAFLTDTWTTQTSGTTQTLNAIAVNSSTTNQAVAAGNNGTLLITFDSGTTWSALTSGTTENLNAATFVSPYYFVVGNNGTTLRIITTGSLPDTLVTSLSGAGSVNLQSVTGTGTSVYAVGGSDANIAVFRILGAEASWSTMGNPPILPGATLRGVYATSSTDLVAIADSQIFQSTNGGSSWTDVSPTSLGDEYTLTGVTGNASPATYVVVGTPNLILYTTTPSTASSWTVHSASAAQNLRAVSCTDSSNCWAFGNNATVLRTTDGAAWSTLSSAETTNLLGGAMASATVGWAVGDAGTIRTTSDGWTSFSTQTSGTPLRLRAVAAGSTSVAVAVGDAGVVLVTSNGGSSWPDNYSGSTARFNAVSMPSTSVIWVAGNRVNSSSTASSVIVSTDAGVNWSERGPSGVTVNLNGIYAADSSTGYVVGDSGTILKTTNGGVTWTAQTSGTTANLHAIAAVDSNTLRASGVGVILQTTNGGTTWSSIATSDVRSLRYSAVSFPALSVGSIFGTGNTIFRFAAAYTTPGVVESTNTNTTGTNVSSATLTATSTLNSQTITYALSNDGGTTFGTVTSGTAYTFGTTGSDLRWRATLSTTDTSATPVLTAISLSAETTSSTGKSYKPDEEKLKDYAPPAHAPWPNPEPREPTILTPTSIRWNFSPAGKGGARLLQRLPGGSAKEFTEIKRVSAENPTFIEETGLPANSVVNDRMVQYVPTADEAKLADADTPRELPAVTLPPLTPKAPALVKLEPASVSILLDPTGNAAPVSFAIQDSQSLKWLAESRTLTENAALFQTIEQWAETGSQTLQILGLGPNTAYALRVKARGRNNQQTDLSPSIGFTTELETPLTITAVEKKETALTVSVRSTKEDGTFSRLTEGSSGILLENVTTGTSSGWMQSQTWTTVGLKAGKAYGFRVRTRRSDGEESAPSPIVTIATAGTSEEELKQTQEEEQKKKVAEEEEKKKEEKKKQEERRKEEEKQKPQQQRTQKEEAELPPPPAPAPTFELPSPVTPPAGGGSSETTPTFAPLHPNVPRLGSINGLPIDPTQPPPSIPLDPATTPELVLLGSAEPNTVIIATIASEPLIASTTSDGVGQWEIRIATALIPPAASHTLSLQTRRGQTESPSLVVAKLEVKLPPAQRVADTVLTAATDVAEATAKIVETSTRVAKEVAEATRDAARAIQETVKEVEPQTQAVLTTVVPIVVATNPPLWLLLPRLPLLLWSLITWLLQLLGVRKRRLPWGVVYDAVTKEPIALAIVRVFDLGTSRMVETQVTDRTGRFGVMLGSGAFRLEVTKGSYTFPSKIITGNEDNQWSNVYHGGPTKLQPDASVITVAIPLDPVEEKRPSAKQRLAGVVYELRRAFRLIAPALTWTGTASGIILAAASPTRMNIAIGIVYLVLALLDNLARPKSLKPWGQVIDAATGNALALAAVDLIDVKYNKLLKSRLTDTQGRFAFFPPPGQYRLQARKEGYEMVTNGTLQKQKQKLYSGETVTITEKAPTLSMTIGLKTSPS